MGGLLWLKASFVLSWAADTHGAAQIAVLGILIAGAIAIYGLLLALLGVIDWRDAADRVRRTAARDLRD